MDFDGRSTFMRTWKENGGKKTFFFGFVGHIVKGGLYYPVNSPVIYLTHTFEFLFNTRRSALNAAIRRKL